MAVTAKFLADFSNFYAAVQKADVELRTFESGSGRVTASLTRMANSFSGQKIIQQATLMTEAVSRVGGASTLTANEQARVNRTVTEAIAKYQALGQTAPKAMTDLAAATTSAGSAASTSSSSFSKMGVAIGSFVGATAALLVYKMISALKDFAAEGLKLSAVERSFEKLSDKVNESADKMLTGMRRATLGMVSDFDLMLAANKSILLGLPVTASEMSKLAETATVLGRAMGLDATTALDKLIVALGRSSSLRLDDLGLTLSQTDANKAYAVQIGAVGRDLTDAEKKMAFYTEALRLADIEVANLGHQTTTAAEITVSSWTTIKNAVSSGTSYLNRKYGEMYEHDKTRGLIAWAKYVKNIFSETAPEVQGHVKGIGDAYGVAAGQASALTLSERDLKNITEQLTEPVQKNVDAFTRLREQMSGPNLQRDVALLTDVLRDLRAEGSLTPTVLANIVAEAVKLRAAGATLSGALASVVKEFALVRGATSGLGAEFSNVGQQVGLNLEPLKQIADEAKFFADQAAFAEEQAKDMAKATEEAGQAALDVQEPIRGIGVVATIAYGDLISGAQAAARAVRASEAEITAAAREMRDAYFAAGIITHGSIGGILPGSVPGFASGVSNFSGGPAIVGERGPELVTLPRGASVTPNSALGGVTINNYIDASGSLYDSSAGMSRLGRVVADAVNRAARGRAISVGPV